MTSVRGAVATRDEQQPSIAQFIGRLTPEIARALPKHMDADRIARLALTVVRKDEKLARCIPESFAGALLTASALGLEPGVDGEAYLVPHGRECTLIIGYKGVAKLFWQHPMARHLDAKAVHEKDEFDYAYGLEPFLTHKPAIGERGKVVAYYAVAALSSGAKAFLVLSPEEVKALRGGKTGSNGGIADPQHWMERKTVLKQLLKLLPKSPTLARALDADERTGSELRREGIIDQPPAAIEPAAPEPEQPEPTAADTATGEVLDVEVEDPDEPSWPETKQPADASA